MTNSIRFLKAIADKNRLTILYLLNKYSLCVCDIQKVIPLSQGALSTQLKNLHTTGLLNYFKQGKWIFYEINKNIYLPYSNILNELFDEMDQDNNIQIMISKLEITETCKV